MISRDSSQGKVWAVEESTVGTSEEALNWRPRTVREKCNVDNRNMTCLIITFATNRGNLLQVLMQRPSFPGK